ncbi:hypothetical protein B0H17DRAFT_1182034 [Mycena rosella]|uniref:Uncharacterized protein n=1 Tax=Mycena rosella TaxID=1033263 RepID=A0AAD7D6S2_MYCRO|nr:hypothetical protein B0H17DRAFT_1182034 [Mycena rosella]
MAGDGDTGNNGGAGPSTTVVPAGLVGRTDIISKCSDLVQQFRDAKITKAVACTRIMSAIPDSFVEGGAGEKAAHTYFELLDQAEKERTAAAARGAGAGGAGGAGNGGPRSRSPSPDDDGDRPRSRSPDGGGGGNQARSASPADGSDRKTSFPKLPPIWGNLVTGSQSGPIRGN